MGRGFLNAAFCGTISLCLFSASMPAQAEMFGKHEVVSGDTTQFTKWTEVLARHKQSVAAGGKEIAAWENEVRNLEKLNSDLAKIAAVNKFFNQTIKYKADKDVWGKSDYWATIDETMKKGEGDCDDYAIAKYLTLREMGFAERDMRVVVLKDKAVNEIHAVLSVRLDGKYYILDNQFSDLHTDYEITYYEPIYSINQSNWWKHV